MSDTSVTPTPLDTSLLNNTETGKDSGGDAPSMVLNIDDANKTSDINNNQAPAKDLELAKYIEDQKKLLDISNDNYKALSEKYEALINEVKSLKENAEASKTDAQKPMTKQELTEFYEQIKRKEHAKEWNDNYYKSIANMTEINKSDVSLFIDNEINKVLDIDGVPDLVRRHIYDNLKKSKLSEITENAIITTVSNRAKKSAATPDINNGNPSQKTSPSVAPKQFIGTKDKESFDLVERLRRLGGVK